MKEAQITIRKITQDNCTPCKVVGYMLDAESQRLAVEGANVVETNTTHEPEAVDKYNVMSTPVLIFERNGVEVNRIRGMCNFDDVLGAIELSRFKK